MSETRLSQIAIGERAYETGNVFIAPASWGWQALPVTVQYESDPVTRLGQMPIGVAGYIKDTGIPVNVPITTGDWGWQAYPVDLPAQNISITTAHWGWTGQEPKLCSQYRIGYAGSFNGDTWPTCVWNDHVFGPRKAVEVSLLETDWGWTPNPVNVDYKDPIDVDLTRQDWGWFGYPVGVQFQTDIQFTVGLWGWTSYPVEISLPYGVDLTQQDWGWRSYPVAVSFETDIQLTLKTWGWQSFPVQVDVPSLDINLRWGNWGWTTYPLTVRQTTMLPGDIEAIADAVYAKLAAEGAVQQWLETWQRQGLDSANPQKFTEDSIEVGPIVIDVTEDDEELTQTRQ